MSNAVNDTLLEEAEFYIEYFDSTMMGKVLQADVDANDLEGLTHHIEDARKSAFALEFNPEGDI